MSDLIQHLHTYLSNPKIGLPLALAGGSLLIMKLHIYRYVKKYLLLPIGVTTLVYRLIYSTNSPTILESILLLLNSIKNKKMNYLLSDIVGLIIILTTIQGINILTSLNFTIIKKYIMNYGYDIVKFLPQIQQQLKDEKMKFEATLDHDLKQKSRNYGESLMKLPSKGISSDYILTLMSNAVNVENNNWEGGKVSGSVYHGGKEHQNLLNQAFSLYSLANPLHPDIWPSGMKFESEVIAMTASLMTKKRLNETDICGSTTSGGTESIILAAKAHRDYYRWKYGITEPEIVACVSAHAAIEKACELLSIKLIQVPMDSKTFKVNLNAVEWAITPNTVMIYSSAPQFPQGVIDPISKLSDLAVRYEVGLHVDCCLGGFVLPFAKKLGYDIPGTIMYFLFSSF